jgi:NAD(P)H-hydrate epimerase
MHAIPRLAPDARSIPWLTTAQMAEVDRAMIEDYRILLMQMMEHAGRHLAYLTRARFLAGDARGRDVVILAGPGGNGGGALVCARRLAAWGARVTIAVTADDERFTDVPRHQLEIARRIGLPVHPAGVLRNATPAVVIDGIIGYSLRGHPRGEAADLIRWANASRAPVLALDVPSGLDAATGQPFDPAVRATATMTLALPKEGLRSDAARPLVGELYLADIGVPPELYGRPPLGLDVPDIFAAADLIRVW